MALTSVLLIELVYGPDDGGREIHAHGQEGVRGQEAGEGEGQEARALPYAHHDDGGRQYEADAVDGQAPLGCPVLVVGYGLADEDEYDAGDEGLAHFQKSRRRGHVAGDLSRTGLAETHFAQVRYGGQAGKHGRHDAAVDHLAAARVAFEEVKGEDDGCGQAEERGVAGERDGKVLPGDRGAGLQAEHFY